MTQTAAMQVDEPIGLNDVKIHLVDSFDVATDFMGWLGERRGDAGAAVAFDTETTGLSPEHDRVRLVQFGDARTGWVIPFENWRGLILDAIKRFTGRYKMHNAPYDVAMMRAMGINMPTERIDDTRLRAHVLESTGSTALKSLSNRFVDSRAGGLQVQLDQAFSQSGWDWQTVPITFEPYWTYAGIDTVITYQLEEVLRPKVEADAPLSYDLELAVSWVVERMARNGVKIDVPYIRKLRDELQAHVTSVVDWCKTYYQIGNVGSNPQVVRKLRSLGIPLTTLTRGGAKAVEQGRELTDSMYSVDKTVLAGIDHPLAQAILSHRQADRLISTYLDTYVELAARSPNDRIHPSINSIGGTAKNNFEPGGVRGVRTGRMSMNDPNLQNVPIRTKEGKRIRRGFVPEDMHTWVKADFSQIEMRIFAHASKDPGMRAAFTSGVDFFVAMAREIFQDPTIEKADPRRQPVKNSGYAMAYGAGPEKFALTCGMYKMERRQLDNGEWVDKRVLDVGGAAAFLNRLYEIYPGARSFPAEVIRTARENETAEGVAYIRSPLTRRRHVADPLRLYALTNYYVQGTAGEVLKMKMIEADQAGLGPYMTIPVHDEIDLDVPNGELSDVLMTLHDVMNDDKLLSVPIEASIEIGPNWADVDEWRPTA